MKNLLKLEDLFFVILSIYLFSLLGYAWWWFPLLLFAPDLSMIGYLGGPRLGAIIYNAVHHRAVGISLYLIGAIGAVSVLQLAGLILLAHSSLDRVFGYGLKLPDAFTSTHLGVIGPEAKVAPSSGGQGE
ncbi:MAG: DUF4260 domain-containing protein [Chloroflexota bacterium]|jgi:hypothetical protein